VPAALRRSLKTKTSSDILKSIPTKFTLNTGHVKFFYNKMAFLHRRFDRLALEMERRGYRPNWARNKAFNGFDSIWYGDWESTPESDILVLERIRLRIAQKPHLYKD
jgi:deoxyribonuclease (pyrimidine dimer)